jgi:hypothetical protein
MPERLGARKGEKSFGSPQKLSLTAAGRHGIKFGFHVARIRIADGDIGDWIA